MFDFFKRKTPPVAEPTPIVSESAPVVSPDPPSVAHPADSVVHPADSVVHPPSVAVPADEHPADGLSGPSPEPLPRARRVSSSRPPGKARVPRVPSPPLASVPPPEAGSSLSGARPAVRLPDSTGRKDRAVDRLSNLELENRITKRLNLVDRILFDADGAVLKQKIEKATLRDLAMYETAMIDKLQLVRGQPTQILSHDKRQKLSDVLPALVQEMKRRGMVIPPAKVVNAEPVAHGSQ